MNGRGSALVGEARFTFIDKVRLGMVTRLPLAYFFPLLFPYSSLTEFSSPEISIIVDDAQLSPLGFLLVCLSWLQWLFTTGIGKALIAGIVIGVGYWIVAGVMYTASIRQKHRLEGRPAGSLWQEFSAALWLFGMFVAPVIGIVLGGVLLLYVGYILFWVFSHPS